MSLYVLKDVQQIFGGHTVLDLPELSFEFGKSCALLGPNGSGKTTLLHILALLSPPARGTLYYKDMPVNWKKNFLTSLRRQIVLVDQHPIMFSTTVIKNVEYGLKVRGLEGKRRGWIAMECLERVGMHDFAYRQAHLLSGGETQRVAIARALACYPEVMLFDEPTASVDVENQAVITKIIKDVHKEKGITVIFSTHNRLEASVLAEHKIFLSEGKVTGPGGENLLPGKVIRRNGRHVCVVMDRLELEIKERHEGPCRVMIDPEKINIFPLQKKKVTTFESLVPAKVLQMTAEGENINVLLDMGWPIRTVMTRKEAALSGIISGDEVRISFKEGAARFVS